MQTLDVVSGLHNFKNSPNPSSVYIRLCKHRKKVFYCCYKITFPRKKKNSLFRLLIKSEILTSREVLYTRLNVRVISSCFAVKMLSKKGFFSLKMSAQAKKKLTQHRGVHGGLRYCGIGLFFTRYFGNFNFHVRYSGII